MEVGEYVENIVTFNEPAIFANLVYGVNMWPGRNSPVPCISCGLPGGLVYKALDNMISTHHKIYNWVHESNIPVSVGVAHNVAAYEAHDVFGIPVSKYMDYLVNKKFMEGIFLHMDFMGLNFYGKEHVSGGGIVISEEYEYSDSGRSISPDSLYDILVNYNQEFNKKGVPIIITENGISDASDVLRKPYLIEHLLAIDKAIKQNIPVVAYYHWTVSDNFEWMDGYCSKFGLVDVDRTTEKLRRTKRGSFDLFAKIIKTRAIFNEDRIDAWKDVARNDGYRVFCRDIDGKSTVTVPTFREFALVDWRTKHPSNSIFPKEVIENLKRKKHPPKKRKNCCFFFKQRNK